jgi:hypothetical protein
MEPLIPLVTEAQECLGQGVEVEAGQMVDHVRPGTGQMGGIGALEAFEPPWGER